MADSPGIGELRKLHVEHRTFKRTESGLAGDPADPAIAHRKGYLEQARWKGQADARPFLTPVPATRSLRSCLGATLNEGRPTGTLAGTNKVDAAINTPDHGDSQGQQRFLDRAVPHERPHQIEDHAGQIGQQTKDWDDEVANQLELRMVVIGNQTDHATQAIQQERSEVRSEGYGEQRIRQ